MNARIKRFFLYLIRFFSGKKIIVSLTSYPARYGKLHLVIESLLKQKLKANQIVLYLYEGEANGLPTELLRLQSKRFRIVKVPENIRPHKKYYYAFQDYPHDLIITVDDDVMYPDDLVQNLYQKHLQFRDAVICGRCRKPVFSESGKRLPYNSWPLYKKEDQPELSLVATGVGGVLYTPRLLDQRVLDLSSLKELALNQDDLWLKTMELLKGTKTVLVSLNWRNSKNLSYDSGLFSTNEYGENDKCIRRLMDYYHISEDTLKD